MTGGADMIFQKEFEDLGVNIGFMAIRNTEASRSFWDYVHAEIKRTQALDQRVVNNSLYSGHAAQEFGLRWERLGEETCCGRPFLVYWYETVSNLRRLLISDLPVRTV